MDQGRRPIPGPNHEGQTPTTPTTPDMRVPSAVIAAIYVSLFVLLGMGIYWFDGDFAQSVIAGVALGFLHLFSVMIQSLRGG